MGTFDSEIKKCMARGCTAATDKSDADARAEGWHVSTCLDGSTYAECPKCFAPLVRFEEGEDK
jgi:hypothetical protein